MVVSDLPIHSTTIAAVFFHAPGDDTGPPFISTTITGLPVLTTAESSSSCMAGRLRLTAIK